MKNLKIFALLTLVIVASLLCFTACDPADEHVHSFSNATCTVPATCECGATDGDALGHSYNAVVTAPTCTEDGYTTYTCTACGDSYVADEVKTEGHSYNAVVTAPTCTEDGYTTYTCTACEDSYVADEVKAHHTYESVVTAPTCSAGGYTTYTCTACEDSYVADETEIVPHVDANLDITCDFEGCTHRILPPADSKISLFTAKHMIIVSLSNSYYVEGVIVEITDAKNGIFVIRDEAGDEILIRLPKNADGVAYSAWTDVKVVVGDTVQLYGKPSRNTAQNAAQEAKLEGGILTILKHEHSFSEVTCTEDSVCGCLAVGTPALGHVDEDADGMCDRCPWNMNLQSTNVTIATDPSANGVLAEDQTSWTWSKDGFDVVIAKGTSTYTLYKTAKAYMQLKKLNTLTISGEAGTKINSVTIYTTNATQLNNLKGAIGSAYTYTVDEAGLSVTIELASVESFTLVNNGTNTAYVSGVDIVWEKA